MYCAESHSQQLVLKIDWWDWWQPIRGATVEMISLVFTSSNSIYLSQNIKYCNKFLFASHFWHAETSTEEHGVRLAEESSYRAFRFKSVHNFLRRPSISLAGQTRLQTLKSLLPGGSGCLLLNSNSDPFFSSIIHSQDRSVSYWKFCVTTQIPRFWAFEGW